MSNTKAPEKEDKVATLECSVARVENWATASASPERKVEAKPTEDHSSLSGSDEEEDVNVIEVKVVVLTE